MGDEINNKKGEVEDIVAEVKRKEDENRQLQEEMDLARQRQEEASQALIAATTTPRHHHLQEMDGASDDEEDQRIPNGDHSQNLREDDEDLMDPVDERQTLAEKNERLQSQLRSLKEDLANTRDDQNETTMDKIHRENVKQGRDKYKTLREVRKGNTKRRVDQFENM